VDRFAIILRDNFPHFEKKNNLIFDVHLLKF